MCGQHVIHSIMFNYVCSEPHLYMDCLGSEVATITAGDVSCFIIFLFKKNQLDIQIMPFNQAIMYLWVMCTNDEETESE